MKSLIIKPNKENLTTFVSLGSFFIFFALIDLLLSTFFDYNLTGFLPESISFFIPLGFISYPLQNETHARLSFY